MDYDNLTDMLSSIFILFLYGVLGFIVLTIIGAFFGLEPGSLLVSNAGDEGQWNFFVNIVILLIYGVPTKIIYDKFKK